MVKMASVTNINQQAKGIAKSKITAVKKKKKKM